MLSRRQLSLIKEQLKSKAKLEGEAKSLMTSCNAIRLAWWQDT